MRYGQNVVWLAAFLGNLGRTDFRRLAPARTNGHGSKGTDLPMPPASLWSPILSIRSAQLPYCVPASLVTTRSGAGLSYLLAIAYDCCVLGLGPDSPWDD